MDESAIERLAIVEKARRVEDTQRWQRMLSMFDSHLFSMQGMRDEMRQNIDRELQVEATTEHIRLMFAKRAAKPRIVSTPGVAGGAPCLDGTGLMVSVVVGRFAGGEHIHDIASDYDLPDEAVVEMIRALVEACYGRRGLLADVERRLLENCAVDDLAANGTKDAMSTPGA